MIHLGSSGHGKITNYYARHFHTENINWKIWGWLLKILPEEREKTIRRDEWRGGEIKNENLASAWDRTVTKGLQRDLHFLFEKIGNRTASRIWYSHRQVTSIRRPRRERDIRQSVVLWAAHFPTMPSSAGNNSLSVSPSICYQHYKHVWQNIAVTFLQTPRIWLCSQHRVQHVMKSRTCIYSPCRTSFLHTHRSQ